MLGGRALPEVTLHESVAAPRFESRPLGLAIRTEVGGKPSILTSVAWLGLAHSGQKKSVASSNSVLLLQRFSAVGSLSLLTSFFPAQAAKVAQEI